jgi:hypothetical protein
MILFHLHHSHLVDAEIEAVIKDLKDGDETEDVVTTLHFLRNLRIGLIC